MPTQVPVEIPALNTTITELPHADKIKKTLWPKILTAEEIRQERCEKLRVRVYRTMMDTSNWHFSDGNKRCNDIPDMNKDEYETCGVVNEIKNKGFSVKYIIGESLTSKMYNLDTMTVCFNHKG